MFFNGFIASSACVHKIMQHAQDVSNLLSLLCLLVYKSTFYDLNFSPKNGPRLIHKSYTKKKIGFEALKMGIDLYTSSTYTQVNIVLGSFSVCVCVCVCVCVFVFFFTCLYFNYSKIYSYILCTYLSGYF